MPPVSDVPVPSLEFFYLIIESVVVTLVSAVVVTLPATPVVKIQVGVVLKVLIQPVSM